MFRAAFINIGVSNCDMGTSWLLPRLIGASRAHELMLTGRRVDAQEALEIPSERAAVEYEGRQQIMSTFGQAPPEAIAAFLDKRPAEFAD